MSGRMNWDRVRKENLVHLHGSEWVSPVANASLANDKNRKNKKRDSRLRKSVPPAARMVGCTCGKTIGFTGAHKKRCPLCRTQVSIASAKQVAVIGRSDEARPAVERASAKMPQLAIGVSAKNLEMRLECPKCEFSLPASKIKQHCIQKHSYTDALWKKFMQRQTSQTVVDLLENRRSPEGSSIGKRAKSVYKLFAKHRQSVELANKLGVHFVSGGRADSNPRRH